MNCEKGLLLMGFEDGKIFGAGGVKKLGIIGIGN